MEQIRQIWQPDNIENAGMIGKRVLSNDSRLLFDGRELSTDSRGLPSLEHLINQIYNLTQGIVYPSNIIRPKLEHTTNIITGFSEGRFRLNSRGFYVSIEPADGIILRYNDSESIGKIPVLGTADCVPLIFQGTNCSGIIHIGHQGLFGEGGIGIIENLATKLKEIEGNDLSNVKFSIGPAAERLLFPKDFIAKIPKDFYNQFENVGLIQLSDPGEQLRRATFDKEPSNDTKLLIQFTSLVVAHLSRVLEIEGSKIERSNIDTTNGVRQFPSHQFFSRRRDWHDDQDLRERFYGNNLTYLIIQQLLAS